MRIFFRNLLRLFGQWLVRLRYRVTIKNQECFDELEGPLLIMPNHPGYIDPALILLHLPGRLDARPLVFEDTFQNPVLKPFVSLLRALVIPNLKQRSGSARNQTREVIDRMAEALEQGDCFVIYPSGRLQRRGTEVIGAASATADLLRRCPKAKVVLARTTGLWGSQFGFAQTGQLPNLGRVLLRSTGLLIANLLFLAPKREVTIYFEHQDRSSLPEATPEKLNPWLEEWYNRGVDATPVYVPYHFAVGPRTYEFPALSNKEEEVARLLKRVDDAVREEALLLVEENASDSIDRDKLQPTTPLEALGFDSLGRMDLAMAVEQRFGVSGAEVPETYGELLLLAAGLAGEADTPLKLPPAKWFEHDAFDAGQARVEGETILESFLIQWRRAPSAPLAADQRSGVRTRNEFLIGAQLLGKRFAKLEGEGVGVLLPASVGADVCFFAMHLGGKLPVMLNWTTGASGLEAARRTMNLRYVVTSRLFVDRLGIEMPGVTFVFLEDIAPTISLWEKIVCALRTRWQAGALEKAALQVRPDDPAVVLFTSGSEKAPKAVPLTHRNLITNVGEGVRSIEFQRNDIVLGFLPPFHSFGLAGNMLMPILAGLRVVHHPDPTDGRGLGRLIEAYRATTVLSTPTFLGAILRTTPSGKLQSLRAMMTGAEACPQALTERIRQELPQVFLTEGYGITECSPVVSCGRPQSNRPGTIGLPLDCVDSLVVDPESFEPVADGQRGLLLVKGPTIFPGYLAAPGDEPPPTPFVETANASWYNTGDLVERDPEGFLIFRGRMKRFVKSGGEMISLPAIEAPLAEAFPPTEDGPQVAVEAIEQDGRARITLFAVPPIELREANRLLGEAGLAALLRLNEVRQIDHIPVLGTGKTNYKVLRAELETA